MKEKITYREFAEKIVGTLAGGTITMTDEQLKGQIDALMAVKSMKIKDIALKSKLTYDLCRKFKQLAENYEPVDAVDDPKWKKAQPQLPVEATDE